MSLESEPVGRWMDQKAPRRRGPGQYCTPVSAENVRTVRRMFDAYARGGFAAVAEFTHPDFEMSFQWHHPLGGRTYRAGDAGKAMLEFAESFEDFRAEAQEFIDAGDRVVVAFRERGRARGSIELEQLFGILYTLREGKIARMQWFDSPEEALAAAKAGD
jgi:ketosteroid isomerase-like protein